MLPTKLSYDGDWELLIRIPREAVTVMGWKEGERLVIDVRCDPNTGKPQYLIVEKPQ